MLCDTSKGIFALPSVAINTRPFEQDGCLLLTVIPVAAIIMMMAAVVLIVHPPKLVTANENKSNSNKGSLSM